MKSPLRTRLLGARAELLFSAKCHELGFYVSKPWGDNCPYDFIVDAGERLLRIQVKATAKQSNPAGGYQCCLQRRSGVHSRRKKYQGNEVDLFAICIAPLDLWFIIPFKEVECVNYCYITPHDVNSRYSRYREAWHLLE